MDRLLMRPESLVVQSLPRSPPSEHCCFEDAAFTWDSKEQLTSFPKLFPSEHMKCFFHQLSGGRHITAQAASSTWLMLLIAK